MNVSPINRNNKFFSEDEYRYYVELAREHMASIDSKAIFIKINKEKSQIDDIYGEGYREEIHYEEPIEIQALVELEEADNKAYIEEKGIIRYEEYGKMKVHVLLVDIENLDITYGDIFGYQVLENLTLYFEVSDDNQKHFDNGKTMFGYKPLWKTITCVTTQLNIDKI